MTLILYRFQICSKRPNSGGNEKLLIQCLIIQARTADISNHDLPLDPFSPNKTLSSWHPERSGSAPVRPLEKNAEGVQTWDRAHPLLTAGPTVVVVV